MLQATSNGSPRLRALLVLLRREFIARLVSLSNISAKNLSFHYPGFLELYLLHVDKSLELKETLSEVEKAVDTDYDGSRTYKDVQILVSFVKMCFLDIKKKDYFKSAHCAVPELVHCLRSCTAGSIPVYQYAYTCMSLC